MEDLAGRMKKEESHLEIVELLPWYLNETLDAKERTKVTEHLKSCASCSQELDELKGLQKVITAPVQELSSETALEHTMQQIRSRRKPASAQAQQRPSWWKLDWGTMLRPRMALAVGILAAVFVSVGVFVGLQLQAEKRVKLEEVGSQLTDEYAPPSLILQQGIFKMTMSGSPLSEESFTLTMNRKFKELQLNSKIEASELSRAGQAIQEFHLTNDYQPVDYSLEGPMVYQGDRVHATFKNGQVVMSLFENEKVSNRVVDLKGIPIILDFSVMSHFAVFHRILRYRLDNGESWEKLQFTALAPQALRDEPLFVTKKEEALLKNQGQMLKVTRYRLEMGPKDNVLAVELYEADTGKEKVLVAIRIPVQKRVSSLSDIFAYRSDLYPQGLALTGGEK
ncbi:zf-HC2 domain-containing protein [Candidatus Acetothermia bacterium]|nr:zf-HC2 domain-containing protein [Candidatus Acetothermia bacterium]MBI3660616.1 zf-HC2 domain-containing protein [Candidatus Acetothermia bacterium]